MYIKYISAMSGPVGSSLAAFMVTLQCTSYLVSWLITLQSI